MMAKGDAEAWNDDSCHCKLAKNEGGIHNSNQIAGKVRSSKNLTVEWSLLCFTPCSMNVFHGRERHKADMVWLYSNYVPYKSIVKADPRHLTLCAVPAP
jgi:hypothetical protein